jgi:hypothetical protein
MVSSRTLGHRFPPDYAYLFLLFVCWREKPTSRFPCCSYVIVSMAPVVRIEPNGSQSLLSYDDALNELVVYGWDSFIRRFEGYNLAVAQDFTQSFDGSKVKIGDLQLEVTEDSIEQATGLSQEEDRWFKNIKIEGMPWRLLMASKK